MKISIITPCYNSATTVRDSLLSIRDQAYQPIEHIIIDGNSSDNTLNVIEEFQDQIDVVVSEDDNGIYDAMNKGIQRATGEVIGILNSDDFYYSPDVIGKVAAAFKKTEADAVYGDLQYVDWDDKKVLRHWKSGSFKPSKFKRGWMPPHPTFFVKREMYERHGLYDEEFNIAADYELMLRYLYDRKISVSYIPEILVRMRMGGMSNGSWSNRFQVVKQDYLAWKKNGLKPRVHTQVLKRLTKLHQFIPALNGAKKAS